jgi:hypothetical protein
MSNANEIKIQGITYVPKSDEIEIQGIAYVPKQLSSKNQIKKENSSWEIGKKYFIRTVTMHLTGELIAIGDKELTLKDAAWIADSGRFNEALKDINRCKEVEPFQDIVIVGRGSIVDATPINSVIIEVK